MCPKKKYFREITFTNYPKHGIDTSSLIRFHGIERHRLFGKEQVPRETVSTESHSNNYPEHERTHIE